MHTLSGARTCMLARHPSTPRVEVEGLLDYSCEDGTCREPAGRMDIAPTSTGTLAYAVVAVTQTSLGRGEAFGNIAERAPGRSQDAGLGSDGGWTLVWCTVGPRYSTFALPSKPQVGVQPGGG